MRSFEKSRWCVRYLCEKGANESRESCFEITGQCIAYAKREGKKQHWTERILDSSPIARNIHPGQWGVLKPEVPIRGVCCLTGRCPSQFHSHAQPPAGSGLRKTQPSGSKYREATEDIYTQRLIKTSLFSTLFSLNLLQTLFMPPSLSTCSIMLANFCLLSHRQSWTYWSAIPSTSQ